MTRTTRKTVCAVTLICFAVAVLVFLAWGTGGFRNWDAAAWFDYWGKGKPITAPSDKPDETPNAAVMRSVNAGLVYDSDDGVETFMLIKAPIPTVTFGKFGEPEISVYTTYSPSSLSGPSFQVEYIQVGPGITLNTRTYTYSRSMDTGWCFDLTIDELFDAGCVRGGYYQLKFTNLAKGNYSNSSALSFYCCIPIEDDNIDISLDGTTVKVPILGGYSYQDSNSGASGSYNRNSIEVMIGESSNATSARDLLNIVKPSSEDCIEYRSFNDGTVNGLNGSPFSLVDNDGTDNDYYEIDLTKLLFADRLSEVCTIVVKPQNYSNYCSFEVLTIVPEFYFSISRLDTPSNISFEAGLLSWEAVDGAEGYAVFIENIINETVTDTTYKINANLADGTYTVRVRALGNVGKQLSEASLASLTPYNASGKITQLVVMNYSVDGDVVSKFVPYGSTVGEYLYDVELPNKEFGGWYYDNGYSVKVLSTDVLDKDVTVYARLSDVEVTDRPLSWWDKYMWYVLGPGIAVVAIALVVGGVIYSKKKRAA